MIRLLPDEKVKLRFVGLFAQSVAESINVNIISKIKRGMLNEL